MDQWQGYLTGDFGDLLVKSGGRNQDRRIETVKAKTIRFKFPSEHSIDGYHYPCEMQIYHQSQDESRVAISIFLTDDEN